MAFMDKPPEKKHICTSVYVFFKAIKTVHFETFAAAVLQ